MAGIFGYLKKTNHYDPEKIKTILSENASAGFGHPVLLKTDQKKLSAVGCSAPFYDDSWPLQSKNNLYLFQIFGHIFLPDGSLLNKNNFEEGFLVPFLRDAPAFLSRLDGAFVFVLLNKAEQSLFLCNDPFCNFSVYYYNDNDIFIFSTQVHAIRDIINNTQWDTEGFNQYLGLGFSLDGKSCYRNIRRLKPAEFIKVSAQSITQKQYLLFDYHQDREIKETIKKTAESVYNAVQKRVVSSPSLGAAITGGFDSRVTWAIINHLNQAHNVSAFTHGLADSRDMQIARKIAKKLNLDHKIKIFDAAFIEGLADLWEPFVRYTDGTVSVASAHALKSWEFGSQFYNTLMDSHGGVLFRRQFIKVAEKRFNPAESFAGQFYQKIKSPLITLNVLRDEVEQQANRSCIDGLSNCFSAFADDQKIGNKIDWFYLYQISPYKYSAAANVQMNWLMLYHPLLNIKTFEHLQKIPVKYRNNQSVYKHIINSISPELKSFSLENMGMPAPYFGFNLFRYPPMIYEKMLNLTVRRINYSSFKKLTLQKFVSNYDLFYRINFNSVKNILFRENDRFYEIVDREKLGNLILFAEKNVSYRLSSWSALLTLKLFMDIFHKQRR
jgi:Asparagine synthase/Glutamine amidotransferase domain